MSQDTLILVAFCIFAFLVGMRIKDRIKNAKNNKNEKPHVKKNQRPKVDEEVKEEFERREKKRNKRIMVFTVIQIFVIGGLILYMIPTLFRDWIAVGEGTDFINLTLRTLIFIVAIYIFILSYFKVFRKKDKKDDEN